MLNANLEDTDKCRRLMKAKAEMMGAKADSVPIPGCDQVDVRLVLHVRSPASLVVGDGGLKLPKYDLWLKIVKKVCFQTNHTRG